MTTTEKNETTDETTPEETTPEEPAEETPAAPKARLPLARIAVALVALVLLGAGGFAGYQWYQASQLDSARSAALTAARGYATDLATYDHTRINENFRTVSGNSTDQFARQYQQVSDSLTKLIQQYQAVSKGTVIQAGVVEASTDRAVVVLFVDQTITNTNSPQPRIDRNRMQVTLVQRDGRWLLDDVQLL